MTMLCSELFIEKKQDNKAETNSCLEGFVAIKSYKRGEKVILYLWITVKRTMGGRENTNHCNRCKTVDGRCR